MSTESNPTAGKYALSLYTPLDTSLRQIRLLEVHKPKVTKFKSFQQKSHRSIECSLLTVTLNEKPSYSALSYVWGNPKDITFIHVNGTKFEITSNLSLFLDEVARSTQSHRTTLWIDAICINQKDNEEKSHQVGLMREIYENADQVHMWIGEALSYGQHELCGPLLKHLLKSPTEEAFNLIRAWSRIKDPQNINVILNSNGLWDAQAWKAIHAILDRPYWNRIWVVQEAVCARRAEVLCGQYAMNWHDFQRAVVVLFEVDEVRNLIPPDRTIMLLKGRNTLLNIRLLIELTLDRLESAPSYNLPKLLELFSRYEASDPKDKIYALLGLPQDLSITVIPDYTICPSTLYRDVFRKAIQHTGSLKLLCFAGSAAPNLAPNLGLPTWCPDFRAPEPGRRAGFLHPGAFSASADEMPEVSFSEKNKSMNVKGTQADLIIAHVYTSVTNDVFNSLAEIRELARSTPPIHPTGIPRLQALFRTLIFDESGFGYGRPEFKSEKERKEFFESLMDFLIWTADCVRCTEGVYFDRDQKAKLARANISDYARCCAEITGYVPEDPEQVSDQTLLEPLLGSLAQSSQWIQPQKDEFRDNKESRHAPHVRDHLHKISRRSFFITKGGYMGMATGRIEEGDVVSILLGCPIPMAIRKEQDGYSVLGSCYVYGMMNGEMIDEVHRRNLPLEEFEFR